MKIRILKPSILVKVILSVLFFLIVNNSWSQGLSVNSCPSIDKRNNGNGQYASAAGIFPNDPNCSASPPTGCQNNPVANNVIGTSYQSVSFLPASKTGFYNFFWSSSTPLTNFPVITRVWITADGSETPTLSSVKFGPPPPPVIVGQNYYVNYSFYGQNIPPVGKITLEFTDPQTGLPSFTCTYDLKTNNTATAPTGFSCAPTISTQPSNQSLCGNATAATFSVTTVGAASWQWQVYDAGSNSWSNVSGADYSGATTRTLIISNPTSYDGKQYRVIATGTSVSCTVTSDPATLVAKPLPTATFGITNCTQDQQNVAITLTGTKPWSFSYNSGGGATTISNITASPYYFPMSGSSTYTITSLSDAYCTNSGTVATKVLPTKPTITLSSSSLSMCVGVGSASLVYTATTNTPNQYSLTAGTRAMPGFTTLTNQSLTASPVSIPMPSSGVSAGTYDFNLTVINSITGCISAIVPITVIVRDNPILTATAGTGSVCKSTNFTLTAAPSGLTSYSWGINPATSGVGSSAEVMTQITSTTTFKVLGTDSYGCAGTATVTVTALDGPTLTISPSAPTICSGSAVALSVSGGNTYTWSESGQASPNNLSATSGDVVVASPTVTRTYTVTSVNLTGCSSTGTVTVTVSSPSISATASATICSGNIKQLDGTGAGAGGSYFWYPVTGLYTDAAATTAYTANSNNATVYSKPSSTTTYYLKGVTSSGCEGVASSTVTISSAPIDVANSTANYYVFCVQSANSVDLTIKLNQPVTSATWAYSIDGSTYTSLPSAQSNVSGTTVDLTPSSSGTSPNITYVCNVAGYSNGGLASTDPNFYRLVIVGSACTYNYDIRIADTKGLTTLSAPTASRTTICSGNSILLSSGSINANSSPKWQSSADNSTWTDISGATSSTYLASPVSNTYYRVEFDNGNGNCGATTSSILISVASALSSNTVSTLTVCTSGSGSSPTLDGSAITSGIYQWQSSADNSTWSDILGAVSEDYSLSTNILSSTNYYRRVASTANCSSTNSSSVAIYPPISNNQISTVSATSYCGTASAISLSGTTPTGGNSSYTYKWQQSTTSSSSGFSDIGSATSINFTTLSRNQTYWYKRIVSSNNGSCTDESSVIQVTVNPNPTVAVTASSTTCQGAGKSLSASGAQTYSWAADISPSGLSATTGPNVTATPSSTATYTVTGTNEYSCTGTATTTVSVTSLPAAPVLTSSSTTICSNGSAVTLSSYNPGSGTTKWFSVPEPTAAYEVSSVSTAGTYYAYQLSNGCYSSSNSTFVLTVKDLSAPVVNTTSVKLCTGTFDLTTLAPTAAAGTTLEWRTSNVYGSGSSVANPSSVSSGTYYLFAVSSSPSCNSTASTGVVVSVNAGPTASVSSSTSSVCSPTTVNLTSLNNTSGSNTYGWYTSSSPSPATLVLIPESVSTSGTYYLFATNSDGCQGTSASVAVTINSKPTSTVSASEDFCDTYSGSITATTDATGSPSYAWEYSTNNGSTWTSVPASSPYSNTTTSVLGISGLTVSSGGTYYRCTVTKSDCSTISEPAIVITQGTPVTTSCPSNTYMQQGTNQTFTTSFEGAADAIQWEYSTDNGVTWNNVPASSPYSGTTSKSLQITGATLSMDGYRYRSVLSNSCGSTTCTAFTLAVGTSLPVTWLSFTASKIQEKVLLSWITGTEINTKDFEVQYSTNATNWSAIGTVLAAGNSTSQRSYSFTHTSPLKNNNYNYYRILQRDLDGKFSYSKIVSILFNEPGPDVVVYPNPVEEVLTIYTSTEQVVSLYNAAGSLVWKAKLPAGRNQLPVNKFSKGVYILATDEVKTRVIIR